MTLQDLLKENSYGLATELQQKLISITPSDTTGVICVLEVVSTDFEKTNGKFNKEEMLDVSVFTSEQLFNSIVLMPLCDVVGKEICQLSLDTFGAKRVVDAILSETTLLEEEEKERVRNHLFFVSKEAQRKEIQTTPWKKVKEELDISNEFAPTEEELSFLEKLNSINENAYGVFEEYCKTNYFKEV